MYKYLYNKVYAHFNTSVSVNCEIYATITVRDMKKCGGDNFHRKMRGTLFRLRIIFFYQNNVHCLI